MPSNAYLKSYTLGLTKKRYTPAALAVFGEHAVCYEAAFNLSFQANGHPGEFYSGDNITVPAFPKHDFSADIQSGIVIREHYAGIFEPMDMVIFARKEGGKIIQSHVMLCIHKEFLGDQRGVHFVGVNNLYTFNNEVITSGYIPSKNSTTSLFVFPTKSDLRAYLSHQEYIVLRMPWHEVHSFALDHKWIALPKLRSA